jgi:hypothetical protein
MLTDRQRERIEAMRREGRAAGDLDDIEEAAATPEGWPGARRNDPVGDWPSDRLHELIEARPDLLGELIRRRPGEVSQA